MRCADCTDTMVPRKTWTALTDAERKAARARGEARVASRGLCTRCERAHHKAGTLIDFERTYVPAVWRAEDYENIRHQLPVGPDVSVERRLRVAGDLLGCHPGTLRNALVSAGVAA